MSEAPVAEGPSAGDAIGRIVPNLPYEPRLDGEPVDPERFLTAERD